MKCVIYSRVSSSQQDNERQISNLKSRASDKNWELVRTFQEKISGTSHGAKRVEFSNMLKYLKENTIHVVMVSEISRIGRKVVDVLNNVEALHHHGVALYVQQFDMVSLNREGKEDPIFKLLLQMLSIGAEMENDLRKVRQEEGIKLAKLKSPEKYAGRQKGATMDRKKYFTKYSDVVDLISKSDLSLRKISSISGRSINTVRKVKSVLEAI